MKQIRIVDEQYRLLCEVEDGKKLSVFPVGMQQQVILESCHYLDETHFRFGSKIFHISQFGEWLKKNEYQVKPYGYSLDYRKYPIIQYFGHDYYCLEKTGQAAFYYNPMIELPFMVRSMDQYGDKGRGIPYAGDTFTWVCGYDHEKAEWGIGFDMEKIKNIVSIQLPQIVIKTDKMELEAQLNMFSLRRIDLQEAYVERDLLAGEERDRLLEEIYELDRQEPKLLIEARLKAEYAGSIKDPMKVFAGQDFSYCDLSDVDFWGYTFLQCDFTECVVKPEEMSQAMLIECSSPSGLTKNEEESKENMELRHGKRT